MFSESVKKYILFVSFLANGDSGIIRRELLIYNKLFLVTAAFSGCGYGLLTAQYVDFFATRRCIVIHYYFYLLACYG